MGIVFVQTTQITSPVVALFISDYDSIFTPSVLDDATASPILESLSQFQPSPAPDPAAAAYKHQRFSEIATSGFSHTPFLPLGPELGQQPQLRKHTGDIRDAISKPIAVTSSTNAALAPSPALPPPSPSSREHEGSNGSLELPTGPPAEAKRKSSYTRLREGMGMGLSSGSGSGSGGAK